MATKPPWVERVDRQAVHPTVKPVAGQDVGWTGFPSTRPVTACMTTKPPWVERVDGHAVHPTVKPVARQDQAALTSVNAAACGISIDSGTAFFTAVISAMIEIAISAGVLLPM